MSAILSPLPFLVLTLPRSRSAWLAHWLSYPGRQVGHDICIRANSIEEFLNSYTCGMNGTVETGAMLGWRLLRHEIPNLQTLVVLRDPREVVESLARKGLHSQEIINEVFSRSYMLSAISSASDVQTIEWTDLNSRPIREQIFEWLLELPFDEDWDARFANTNIQIDFEARVEQLASRREQIVAFKREVIARQAKIGLAECPMFH